MKPMLSRRADGEIVVLPRFLVWSDGYTFIYGDDATEGDINRLERRARLHAEERWREEHADDTVRAEVRHETPPMSDGRRAVAVRWTLAEAV